MQRSQVLWNVQFFAPEVLGVWRDPAYGCTIRMIASGPVFVNRAKSDLQLWHRLEGYSFHERPLSQSIVDRLHIQTGHPVEVCYTLVEEYRRFMYLVGSTGDPLTPSPIVDLVWRLHIEDRRAYFDDFCPRVIGRTIHHPDPDHE